MNSRKMTNLACFANLPGELYFGFACIIFFVEAKLSKDLINWLLWFFTVWNVFVFLFIWEPILGKIYKLIFIQHAIVLKRIWITQFQVTYLNDNILVTSSANFIKIGSVTHFWTRRQNWHMSTNILARMKMIVTTIFSVGLRLHAIIHLNYCVSIRW